MLVQSHLFMARKINSKLGGNINQYYFYMGNIAPDFLFEHKKRKHEFKYSMDYVIEEINCLKNISDKNLYSYKMGIISHYLMDFFCKAHNCQNLIDDLWGHFKYESSLHKVLVASKTPLKLNTDIGDIKKYITKKYYRYLEENPSVVTDIIYSMEVCHNVVNYLSNRIDNNILKKSA